MLRTRLVVAAPILVLLFGNGYAPKIIIAALISFFPTLVNMVRGLEAVEPSALELMLCDIVDTDGERLLLGRDRTGKKPLHYWYGDGTLVFASEIKGVLAHPAVPRELDERAFPRRSARVARAVLVDVLRERRRVDRTRRGPAVLRLVRAAALPALEVAPEAGHAASRIVRGARPSALGLRRRVEVHVVVGVVDEFVPVATHPSDQVAILSSPGAGHPK